MYDTGLVLQALNGMLAPTALWAFFVFVRYLYRNQGLQYSELRPAIAIMSMCAAESVLRLPVFVLRIGQNSGQDWMEYINQSYIVGGFGVFVAFLCIIRVFSPEKWGVWSWLVPMLISVVVTIASFLYVIWR